MTMHPNSPNDKLKLSGIEAGRGIAAMMVVFYHAARHLKADYGAMPWGGIAQFGHAGVDFFFVLSGFIIFFVHQQDLGRPSTLLSYFERRFTRIYPLFWFSLCVSLGLTALSSTKQFPAFSEIVHQATLVPFLGDVGVAWTLQHEVLFYLLFAIAIVNRRAGAAIFGLWFCLIIGAWATGYAPTDSAFVSRLASTFNLEFVFGMLAAYIVKRNVVTHPKFVLRAGIAFFAIAAAAENVGLFDGYGNIAKLIYGLSSMLIVIGTASANISGRLEAPKFLTRLGGGSYSIYLLHLPCIGIIYKLLAITGVLPAIPLSFLYLILSASAVVICIVISKIIEYPMMSAIRRAIRKRIRNQITPTPHRI